MGKIAGEKTIMEANNGVLRLTTHRVRLDQRSSGRSKVVSITLDAVASCGLVTKNHPLLLGLGVLAAVLGVGNTTQARDVASLLFFVALVLVVAYFMTRSAVLEIRSAGGSIVVPTRSMGRDELIGFIDALEEAKVQLTKGQPIV